MNNCGKWIAGTVLLTIVWTAGLLMPAQTSDLSKTRSIAEAQHEIVMILIKKKDYGKAADEANKIFQMKWPDDQEPVLLHELLILTREFQHNGQPAVGVRLLETNLPVFKTSKSQAEIWKEKGYLLEKMGRHDDALDCFRIAQKLEVIKAWEAPPGSPIAGYSR